MADAFSYKITTESELYSFDFSQVLTTGETISTASSQMLVMNGVDASPNAMLAGAPVISDSVVSQRLEDGLSGVTYRLVVTVNTSASNTYVGVGDLTVYTASEV